MVLGRASSAYTPAGRSERRAQGSPRIASAGWQPLRTGDLVEDAGAGHGQVMVSRCMSPDLGALLRAPPALHGRRCGDAAAGDSGGVESLRTATCTYEFRQGERTLFFLTGVDRYGARRPSRAWSTRLTPRSASASSSCAPGPRDGDAGDGGRRAAPRAPSRTLRAPTPLHDRPLDAKAARVTPSSARLLYIRLGTAAFDGRITRARGELRAARARGFPSPVRIEDPGPLLHDLRLRKTDAELARPASRVRDQPRTPYARGDARREGRGYARVRRVQAVLEYVFPRQRLRAQRLPVDRGLGVQRVHPSTDVEKRTRRMQDRAISC